MENKKDIMGDILSGSGHDTNTRTHDLDCLIYRSEAKKAKTSNETTPEDTWKVSRNNVSVEVWESSAKIRMRVALGKHRHISMKRIAGIAVDAILRELEKEDQG